ncbi:MAG: hypothetical protein A4E53_00371 [Pelotomaculum sp. PtaB.Bin104]|nr:MAG: hypothetical protein A4E53_00371 [Pelotomaculum sp. PtaB.Bin104]
MDCGKALLLISPHLDGALSEDEENALSGHMAVCVDCTWELELHKRLAGAFQEMGREEIQAPPELCDMVMAKIRTERRAALSLLPVAWRKAAAAAAAMLLIAGGTAGVTAGLKLAGSGKMISLESTLPMEESGTGSDILTPSNPAGTSSIQPGDSGQLPGAASTTDDSRGESAQGNDNNTLDNTGNGTGWASPSSGAIATAPAGSETRALLSSNMKVNHTQLKMIVNDLNEAKIKATSMAAGSGATTQVQEGSSKIVIMRIIVNSDRDTDLISGLNGLGTVFNRTDESQDITSTYNEKLVQFNDLQSRISLTQNNTDQQQLEAQAASYKQQLDTWEAEAGKHVIVLWLESR